MGALSLLAPLLPWLVGLFGIVVAYFTIKHKGVAEERARQEVKQAEATAELVKKIEGARSADAKVDQGVASEIKKIEEDNAPVAPSAPDKFRF